MKDKKQNLFDIFPETKTLEWENLIKKDLKGADYKKRLITKTLEEINIKPYYRTENLNNINFLKTNPGEFPFVRGNNTKAQKNKIRQEIIVNDYHKANRKAKKLISKGVNSLCFILSQKDKISINDFTKLFEGIDIEKNEINFISKKNAEIVLNLYKEIASLKKINPEKIYGSIDFDPILNKTITGKCYVENDCNGNKKMKALYDFAQKHLPNFKMITINASIFPNSGSTAVHETAFALSVGNEYLTKASEIKIDIKKLLPNIQFTFGISSNYFMEIAKFRAIRLLWAKIVEAYIPDNKKLGKIYIHAQTCDANKTLYNPHINILRATTEAMSATISGVESITVNPFDSTYKKTSELSERIARNTQIILQEEAHLDQSVDVAGGSYFIENLTNSIVQHAWKLFLETESAGGYLKALKKGLIQDKIEETVKKRNLNFALRKDILLGANQYPLQNEKALKNINPEIYYNNSNKIKTGKRILIPYQGAKTIEKIRLKTEKSVKTPRVFLLTYGDITVRKARATFATNFFACAGFKIIENTEFNTLEEGIKNAINAKAEITVICSTDEEYPEIAPKVVKGLQDKSIIVIAGYPTPFVEKIKNIGITNFIHLKSDLISTLSDFQKNLNIN